MDFRGVIAIAVVRLATRVVNFARMPVVEDVVLLATLRGTRFGTFTGVAPVIEPIRLIIGMTPLTPLAAVRGSDF